MLKIALPNKGRLFEGVKTLFEDAGLPIRVTSDRALSASLGGEFEALFVRAQDIPEFVADGVAAAGVTGWDLCRESGRDLELLLDLEFGRCRLVVAGRDDAPLSLDAIGRGQPAVRVASAFPRLAAEFFAARGQVVQVVPVSGAAEIAPHLGIAEVVVDLASTGSTLKVNGLRELGTILESSARLIGPGRPAGQPLDARLAELVTALASVIRARGQRYIMANLPRAALDRVREVLPGLNGPTVVDILNCSDLVAVHAVVPASGVYRTIAALKSLGGQGILVTRIERLMP